MDRSEFFRHLADHGDNAYIKRETQYGLTTRYAVFKFDSNAFHIVNRDENYSINPRWSIDDILEQIDRFSIHLPFEKTVQLYVDLHDQKYWEENQNCGPDDCPRCGTDLKYFLNIAVASTQRKNKDQIQIELTAREVL